MAGLVSGVSIVEALARCEQPGLDREALRALIGAAESGLVAGFMKRMESEKSDG